MVVNLNYVCVGKFEHPSVHNKFTDDTDIIFNRNVAPFLYTSQILLWSTNNCMKPVREISSHLLEWCLLAVSVDPQSWNIAHVRHWIQWAVKEFGLEDVNIDDFKLTGKQLCQLKHDEFVQYIPKDQGDIFWTHLELLRKCKFVGEYPIGHMCLEIQCFCKMPAILTTFFQLK